MTNTRDILSAEREKIISKNMIKSVGSFEKQYAQYDIKINSTPLQLRSLKKESEIDLFYFFS